MDFIITAVQIVNVISALSVIVLVLLQHGKGADMGAAFGSGSAGSVFGSAGSANFLSRLTAVFAALFFATCMALVLITSPSKATNNLGIMGEVQKQEVAPAPVEKNKIPE